MQILRLFCFTTLHRSSEYAELLLSGVKSQLTYLVSIVKESLDTTVC